MVSNTLQTAMFDEETLDGLLVILTIDHSSLATPIQVVNNMEDLHIHDTNNSAADETANANTASFTGSPTYVAGINALASGKALNFEPADHADFGSGAEFDTASLTFEFWIEPETINGSASFNSNAMMGRETFGAKGYRLGYNVNGAVKFWSNESGGSVNITTPDGTLVAGVATHVAATYDVATSTARLVVNGATVVTGTGSYVVPDTLPLRLNGTWGGGTRADATYDEFRVWDYAKSDAQILRLMNRRSLGSESGLVGYWPWSGHDAFVGLPFDITLPTDEAGSPPAAALVIDNISQEIVTAVRNATGTPPTVSIVVTRILDQNAVELSFPLLNLRNVRADVAQVSGDLFSEDLQIEPYPADVFTPGYFPGMF